MPAVSTNSNLFFDMKTKGSCTDLTDNYEYNRISGPLGEFFMGSGCKGGHFYSLPFGQVEAKIHQPKQHFN